MPTFTYKAMDPQHRFITGELEAGNLREVYFYPDQLKVHTQRTYRPGE